MRERTEKEKKELGDAIILITTILNETAPQRTPEFLRELLELLGAEGTGVSTYVFSKLNIPTKK